MQIGKFSVLATLGAGAHSSILHVRREDDGREYALKVVNIETDAEKKFLEQAEHEFRVGQMLDHPNLVKVLAFETEKNWVFKVKKAKLLIEFVKGETLDKVKLLKRHKLLRVRTDYLVDVVFLAGSDVAGRLAVAGEGRPVVAEGAGNEFAEYRIGLSAAGGGATCQSEAHAGDKRDSD